MTDTTKRSHGLPARPAAAGWLAKAVLWLALCLPFCTLAETPGWWRRNNLRVVQTNLPDFIAAEIDPDDFVADLQDMAANTLIINVGGIMAFYPTKLEYHYRNRHAADNLIGDIVKKCHERAIKVIVRVDFSRLHKQVFDKHPDWCYRSADDERMVNDDIYVVSINAPYVQEKAFEIIEEIMDMYPIDGIFLNMPGYQTSNAYTGEYFGIDHNPFERERFAQFSGGLDLPKKEDRQDPVFLRYLEYKQAVLDRWAERLHQVVKGKNPQIAICTYTDKFVDIIRHESQRNASIPYWPYTASDNVANTLGTYPGHIVSNASIQQISFRSRFNAVEPEEVRIRLYENIANGSGLDVSMMGQIAGNADARNFDVMREVYRFHRDHERYYGRYTSEAKVAVLSPSLWVHGDMAEEYRGLQLMLKEAHIPFDIIGHYTLHRQPDRLKQYKAIVVPSIAGFNPADLAVLASAARSGTSLIATNRAFINHPDFLEQFFGAVPVEGEYDGTGNYLWVDTQDGFAGLPKQTMLSWQYNLGRYKFPTAKTLFPILSKGRPGPPENVGGHEDTGYTAAAMKATGKSTHVLLPGHIGKLYFQTGYEQYKLLWLALLEKAYPQAGEVIKTNAPAKVELIWKAFHWNDEAVNEQRQPDGHILHLINLSGYNGNTYFAPYPIHNTELDVLLEQKPAKVYTLKGNTELPFSWKNHRLTFSLPRLEDYEAVVVVPEVGQ
ncbi:family 10 glycosylhydrolase [Parapedobacter sp. ISTM3]|uniref:alpha-amylase family protein n=1 Tax=Parapedobacter sp. ISTM3 TaxID=2800130 RepID=UPI001905013C|nr:alpha-amylase family protein [Parapedobacter sp. ISTM3]MBK1440213.1 family 10 glycosylhydrolase [Parapedobacter sp. ISTM3]